MKSLFTIIALVLTFSAHAQNVSLRDIVLGVDYEMEPGESPYMFPCLAMMGSMFCDSNLTIKNQQCARTISFSKTPAQLFVNCQMNGEKILLAQSAKGERAISDDTQPAGYFYLVFNPRVKLVTQGRVRMLTIDNK